MVKVMDSALPQINGHLDRVRVRVPGKYIVLASAIAAVVFLSSLSYLKINTNASSATQRAFVEGNKSYLPLEPFLVDLSPDANGQITYLRMNLTLVLVSPESASDVVAISPFLRERIAFFLRELMPGDLAGTDGMERVKVELLRRVNLFAGHGVVADVVISDIVIQ